MKYVARQSENIKSDIIRNYSSWNFGEDGFEGTEEELNDLLNSATEEMPVSISMFDIYPNQVKDFEFAELYDNYWVAIDRVNAGEGLSCIELESDNLADAIEESKIGHYFGDGSSFDARNAKLVYSHNDIHIFEID